MIFGCNNLQSICKFLHFIGALIWTKTSFSFRFSYLIKKKVIVKQWISISFNTFLWSSHVHPYDIRFFSDPIHLMRPFQNSYEFSINTVLNSCRSLQLIEFFSASFLYGGESSNSAVFFKILMLSVLGISYILVCVKHSVLIVDCLGIKTFRQKLVVFLSFWGFTNCSYDECLSYYLEVYVAAFSSSISYLLYIIPKYS